MENWEWIGENVSIRCTYLPGAVLILRFSGELDLFDTDSVRIDLEQHVDPGLREVVLDLGGLSFIDSAGISLLVRIWRRYHRQARVSLVVSDGPCRMALDVAGVSALFPTYTRLEDSLNGVTVCDARV
jgi:anti-sigma B factor antagonist